MEHRKRPHDPLMRWAVRVDTDGPNGCWLWLGTKGHLDYGRFRDPETGRMTAAHRWGYQILVGPVPDELHMDHLCRNPPCVNPDHLEPVTVAENARRGLTGKARGRQQQAKTHCNNGHPYDETNTYQYHRKGNHTGRCCRACVNEWSRQYRARQKVLRTRDEARLNGRQQPTVQPGA